MRNHDFLLFDGIAVFADYMDRVLFSSTKGIVMITRMFDIPSIEEMDRVILDKGRARVDPVFVIVVFGRKKQRFFLKRDIIRRRFVSPVGWFPAMGCLRYILMVKMNHAFELAKTIRVVHPSCFWHQMIVQAPRISTDFFC